ncbi:PTS mannose/fructose/sorbose transporter subunit IIB, partial [Escherichia coli]
IGKAVNILPEDEERLKRLIDKQIEVEIRQVPADKKVDVREVL